MSFYNQMSDTEKEQFHTMAKEIAIMKRWLPIFMAIGAIIGFSVKGTLWFDSTVAKKSDTDAIRSEIQEIKKSMGVVNNTFTLYTQNADAIHSKINGRIDSLGRIVAVRGMVQAGWFTERKDKNGNIHKYTVN